MTQPCSRRTGTQRCARILPRPGSPARPARRAARVVRARGALGRGAARGRSEADRHAGGVRAAAKPHWSLRPPSRGIFDGSVGLVPSATVNGSIPKGGPAWTLHGKPLHPYTDIALDRIGGPVLVAGAGQDQVSGSEIAVRQIGERLDYADFRFRHEDLDFPNAGHDAGFALPYLPQPDPQRWGGTRRAGAAAAVVVWRHILGFLARLQ